MKNLKLSFAQRLGTSNILGKATGPLGKMIALSAVFNSVKFSDEELALIKITDLGGGMQTFFPPSPTFGNLETQIEDAQAETLRCELTAYQGLTVNDVAWFSDLTKQLEAQSVKATEGKRK